MPYNNIRDKLLPGSTSIFVGSTSREQYKPTSEEIERNQQAFREQMQAERAEAERKRKAREARQAVKEAHKYDNELWFNPGGFHFDNTSRRVYRRWYEFWKPKTYAIGFFEKRKGRRLVEE